MQATADCASLRVPNPNEISLSIVIIGRNEGQRLARCLESVQYIRGIGVKEVIYVDSASTDASMSLARQRGARAIAVTPERPTAAIGRNAGWRSATSDLVLFLDGDTVLDPDFARAAWDAMSQDASVVAVWGHRRELHPEASLYNRILDLDWIYAPGFTEFCGGDVLMSRRALVETGGFDERLIAGEEPELCRRMRGLGYSILHIDHPMTLHDLGIKSWSQYWRRAKRAGHAYAEVSERFRQSNDPFWNSERRRNLVQGCFWIGTFAAAAIAGIRFGLLPIALWALMVVSLSIRSAWKARWKRAEWWVCALYGFHSHLQQIPILVGQLEYILSKVQGKTRELIEYKERRAG